MEMQPPLCSALTEVKGMSGKRRCCDLGNDTMRVSLQLSCFYLSHTSLLVTSCHSFSRSMVFRMPYATDVMLFLMDDSAEDRVDTETERVPSLDCRNAPLPRTFCHRDWISEFSRSASNRITTRRILFTRMEKPFLQAKRASMSSMRTETQNR